MQLNDLKLFWEEMGKSFPTASVVTPTSRDPYLGRLEEQNILDLLRPDQNVLEVGCGDGSHTMNYARNVARLTGLDIAESLVQIARRRMAKEQLANVELLAASVLDLSRHFRPAQFDCVISQRCLINLPTWEHQQDAVAQVHQLLRPGGRFLMTEGFQEPLDQLNVFRAAAALPPINTVSYNRNLKLAEFESFCERIFRTVQVRDYGLYLFLSRVFHPLTVLPEQPKHDSILNRSAAQLAEKLKFSCFRGCSYNLFYVLEKK